MRHAPALTTVALLLAACTTEQVVVDFLDTAVSSTCPSTMDSFMIEVWTAPSLEEMDSCLPCFQEDLGCELIRRSCVCGETSAANAAAMQEQLRGLVLSDVGDGPRCVRVVALESSNADASCSCDDSWLSTSVLQTSGRVCVLSRAHLEGTNIPIRASDWWCAQDVVDFVRCAQIPMGTE